MFTRKKLISWRFARKLNVVGASAYVLVVEQTRLLGNPVIAAYRGSGETWRTASGDVVTDAKLVALLQGYEKAIIDGCNAFIRGTTGSIREVFNSYAPYRRATDKIKR